MILVISHIYAQKTDTLKSRWKGNQKTGKPNLPALPENQWSKGKTKINVKGHLESDFKKERLTSACRKV